MATQNVCQYFKFRHCKFSEKCRKLHVNEHCENLNCEIRNCNLRHPRICKFFREYNRCKFSDYCSFKHVKSSNSFNQYKEILEKLDNLAKLIEKKDEMLNILDAKVKVLEEKINGVRGNEEENEEAGNEMNNTFCNPFSGFPCEHCDFNAKSSAGLQVHVKAKHKEHRESSNQLSLPLMPEMVVVEELYISKCEECEYISKNSEDLKTHIASNHDNEKEVERSEELKSCDQCEFETNSDQDLQDHQRRNHKKKFKCFTCDFSSETKVELTKHNDIYWYSHRMCLNRNHKKYILEEFEQLKEDGFIVHIKLDWLTTH